MSKVDLTSLEWCELIFKDRNKSYGAYKMRRFGETTGCSLDYRHCCGFGRIYLTASYQNGYAGSKEEMVEVTRLSTLEEPEIKEETMKKVEPIAPPPPALKSTIKFTAPVIRKDEGYRYPLPM